MKAKPRKIVLGMASQSFLDLSLSHWYIRSNLMFSNTRFMTFPSTYVYPICISNKNCLVFISLAIPTCPHGNRFKNQYFFYMLLQKKKKNWAEIYDFSRGLHGDWRAKFDSVIIRLNTIHTLYDIESWCFRSWGMCHNLLSFKAMLFWTRFCIPK